MKMTTSTTYKYDCQSMAKFLSAYAGILFSSGSTCIRLEKNVTRIAETFNMHSVLSIFPRHIHLTVSDSGGEVTTAVVNIATKPVNFTIITRLSSLSWDIADHRISLHDAEDKISEISSRPQIGIWSKTALIAAANASFCRLFQGDPTAMLTVFIATVGGLVIRQTLSSRNFDFRVATILSAFTAVVIASADHIFSLSTTPDTAIATSVLYLIPGIPLINSFCDMLDGRYICAFGRLMHAIVLTACMSIGLYLGISAMRISIF